jgi:hypothetical protein
MNNIYIKKLCISGKGKKNAEIEFNHGINIIYGPSNTGKTYILQCIDYMFGSKSNPIATAHGYDCISLKVQTNNGSVELSRKLDSNTVNVNSTDHTILSGKYRVVSNANYENTLNALWLKILGISDKHHIIKSETFGKQTLTLRTFIHIFLLNETRIISKDSIFHSGIPTAKTAELSSFLFLLDGEDRDAINTKDTKIIKEAKKTAIVNYINHEIAEFSERRKMLIADQKSKDTAVWDEGYLEEEVESVLNELSSTEAQISDALKNNQTLLLRLQELNIQYAECCLLMDRYENLKTQYQSDIERLNFIVDSNANMSPNTSTKCPICEGKIVIEKSSDFSNAAKAEYKKITLQIQDLISTVEFVASEKAEYEQEIMRLENQKTAADCLINKELKPKIDELKTQLTSYKALIRQQKEIDLLKEIAQSREKKLIDVELDNNDSDLKYKPKDLFPSEFITNVSDNLYKVLYHLNFEDLVTARLDRSSMDAIVNGVIKSEYGKGYRAFLNTVLSLVLLTYLQENGVYTPGFAIYDSPILSLKEKDGKTLSESMKKALFSVLITDNSNMQIIILENEIPQIDYSQAHLIHFTKDRENGRYGLLYDVE